jgi:putative nucleotidyltransferase with HDIG domain
MIRSRSGQEGPSRFTRFVERIAARRILARALILVPVLAAGIALFPPSFGQEVFRIRVGERAPRTVVAEFEFPVLKEQEALEAERSLSATQSPIAFTRQDSVPEIVFRDLGAFRKTIATLRAGSRKAAVATEVDVSQALLVWLMLSKEPGELLDQAESILQDAFDRGLVDPQVDVLVRDIEKIQVEDASGPRLIDVQQVVTPGRLRDAARNRALSRGMEAAPLEELVVRFARPNLVFDSQQTEEIRAHARDQISPVLLRVQRGERIVEAREKVTPEILKKLESYDQWRQKREVGTLWVRAGGWAGRFLLILLAVGTFAAFLRFQRPDLYGSLGDLALLSLATAFVMAASAVVLHVLHLPALMAPVAAAPILVCLLYDERLALVVGVLVTGLVALIADTGSAVMAVLGVGAVTAVFCVRGLHHRREFYRLLLFVPALQILTLLSLALAHGRTAPDLARELIAAIANPVVAAGLAFFAIPLAEHGFRKCSNITLLELCDLNRPLLRRLMVEAPGTYHHSLMVGTLAESASGVAGGNPLLARAIGYYHDIGKIAKPEYFIVNVGSSRKTPHDRLSPSMSRLILESHVREGVSLAIRERLPHVVVEGIRQHHGNSRMMFFWHKARRQDPQAREQDFRYPGPRPQFREAALVMLADQVDAASRALEDPTPSRIKGAVVKVLEARLQEGDLDDCELTISDLARIRDVFVPVLAAFFHARTTYVAPEDDAKQNPSPRDRESPTKGTAS